MKSIPTSLRIALVFIIALWIVGLIALAVGAPGEIIVATAAIGTVGAFVEWTAHRPQEREVSNPEQIDGAAPVSEPLPTSTESRPNSLQT